MRDLDAINPQIARPNTLTSYLFFLPFFAGLGGWALADGAAPNVPFNDNPIAVFSIGLLLLSLLLAPVPWLFKWDWRSRYFGSGLFLLGAFALTGLIPLLCIVVYGRLPRWVSWGFLLFEVGLIVWWCRRFVLLYRRISADTELWKRIYVEESDVVYYLQRADKWAMEEKFKFAQMPSSMLMLLPMIIAFLLVPFMSSVTRFVGVPFTHVFLTIAGIPIVLLCLGLATRGYLIFYYYPWKIKRATGKNVYVDMASWPPDLESTQTNRN